MNRRFLSQRVLCPLIFLAITSCGYVESIGKNHRLVQSTRGMDPATAIACQYQTTWKSEEQPQKSESWYFFRTPTRVERYRPDLKTREIWQKESDDRIVLNEIYLDDKIVIEYFPDQLNLTQGLKSWTVVSSLVDPVALRRDSLLGHTANDNNMMIEYFVTQPPSTGHEVAWLPHLQLPMDLLDRTKTSTRETLLVSCQKLEDSPQKPSDENDWSDYRKVDAVDLGDLEHDPVLKSVAHRLENQSLTAR